MSHAPRIESTSSSPIVHQTPIAWPTWMITASSASGTAMKSRTSGSNIPDYVTPAAAPHPPVARRGSPRLRAEGGLGAVDPHGREPVQSDGLDQRADVRLGAAQPQHAPLRAQALGEAGEVDHQR